MICLLQYFAVGRGEGLGLGLGGRSYGRRRREAGAMLRQGSDAQLDAFGVSGRAAAGLFARSRQPGALPSDGASGPSARSPAALDQAAADFRPEGRSAGSRAPRQGGGGDRHAAVRAPGPGEIVIHVIDEARKVRRDFCCSQSVLLQHMRYFESHFTGVAEEEDVDISVHCDIGVFAWLAEYMQDPRKAEDLDAASVVSILISAEFLQMQRLVTECLEYMSRSLGKVVRLPIDLSCLSAALVRRLAGMVSDEASRY